MTEPNYRIEVKHAHGGVDAFEPPGKYEGDSVRMVADGAARRYQENADETWVAVVYHHDTDHPSHWDVMTDGYDIVRAYVRPRETQPGHPLQPVVIPIPSEVLAEVRFIPGRSPSQPVIVPAKLQPGDPGWGPFDRA
jgi:hypothetical protein